MGVSVYTVQSVLTKLYSKATWLITPKNKYFAYNTLTVCLASVVYIRNDHSKQKIVQSFVYY